MSCLLQSPSTQADDSAIGSVEWLFTWGDVFVADGNCASAEFDGANDITHYLKATNFGFNIPVGAVISGIVVEVKLFQDIGGGVDYAEDYEVKIIKGGVIKSLNKANFNQMPDTLTYVAYGGAGELWGETWTPAQINASNFGVAFAAKGFPNGSSLDVILNVDHIRISVYYNSEDHGIRISQADTSVLTGPDKEMLMTTSHSIPKAVNWEEIDMNVVGDPYNYPHRAEFVPFVLAFATADGTNKVMANYFNYNDPNNVQIWLSANRNVVRITTVGSPVNKKVHIYCFVPEGIL